MSFLNLKPEVGLVDFVTLATTTSVVVATTYNFGFFFSIQGSFVSFLEFQDILIGSAISIIPVGITILTVQIMHPVLSNVLTRHTEDKEKPHNLIQRPIFYVLLDFDRVFNPSVYWAARWKQITAFLLASFLLVLSVVSLVIYDARYWVGYAGTFGALGFWFAFLSSVKAHVSHYIAASIVMLLGLPFMVGYSDFHAALRPALPRSATEVHLTDGSIVRGTLIRATSAYLFVYENTEVRILPVASLAQIGRRVER